MGLWSFRTIRRNTDWRNDISLFGAAARMTPNSWLVRYSYGFALLGKGHPALAIPELQRVLRIVPGSEYALRAAFKLSIAYESLGRLAEAELHARPAIFMDPANAEAWYQPAKILAREQKPEEARRALERAEALAPGGR